VAPTDSPTWLNTRPPPSETQNSSQTLLSQSPANGRIPIHTTTATLGFRSQGGDDYIPVTATRGRRMTRASAAFLPPETVRIPPQTDTPKVFAAFDDALSVTTPDRPGTSSGRSRREGTLTPSRSRRWSTNRLLSFMARTLPQTQHLAVSRVSLMRGRVWSIACYPTLVRTRNDMRDAQRNNSAHSTRRSELPVELSARM
jgi:hypothetical protein